jgi:predicted AlkP superfamily pyrophosphatase or phosphodiesterase
MTLILKGEPALFTRCAIAALVALLVFMPCARAQLMQLQHPRLVLVIVVDQFAYELLTRFNSKFGPNGFRYLQDHGAVFTNCRYKQATTQTAVGHSIIASGAYPWSTGIVANEWLSGSKGIVPSVYDESVQMVGSNGSGASIKAMRGTTFGDSLKLCTNGRSKVFAISLKDRGALYLAGKLGNGAYWYDDRTGAFVSSSQFGSVLPGWVAKFNDKHYADQYFGKAWQRILPETEYTASNKDDYQYEGAMPGDGKTFPHVITGGATSPNQSFYSTFMMTPFANQMLADLAHDAIDQESLGMHTDPDVLSISFSSPDYVGHLFGPQSQESEDTMLRLDQTIGGLLKYIDGKIGLNHTLVVVTGDHGVAPLPEYVRERGQTHGLDSGRIDPTGFKTSLDSALDSRLGPDDWISEFTPPNLYLNLTAIDKQKYRQPEVESLAAKLAHSITGVGEAYTANQLFTNQLPNSPYDAAVRKAYFWGRSGELYVIPRPGYIFSGGQTGTSHGSPYAYDQQVPLIIFGGPVQAGKYGQDASPADIAPTITSILNVPLPPLCEGRVLQEALGQVEGPPAPMQ